MSNITSSSKTTKSYNLQQYEITAMLYNADGETYNLNPDAILQMVIEDDVMFWPTKGFLIYESPYEIMERNMLSDQVINDSSMSSDMKQKLLSVKPFSFRNDGKDYLKLTIRPLLDNAHDTTANLTIKALDDKQWLMDYDFVIYDREDIQSNNNATKSKKLYFWDKQFHNMLTTNIEWSTATSTLNSTKRSGGTYYPSQATDLERSMYTGDAIKSLLQDTKFDVDTSMFDQGSTKVLYTTHADVNLWEDIEYLLAQHMSTKESVANATGSGLTDLCIFTQDRFTKKFQLVPIRNLFKKAGNNIDSPNELQLEHLMFEDMGSSDITVPVCWKSPMLKDLDTTKDVKLAKIKSYQFVDMSSYDNSSQIVTVPVIAYDLTKKTFSISTSESNVESVKSYIEDVYIKGNLVSRNGYHPILTLNKDKKDNKKVNPTYSVRANKAAVRQKGMGQLLYDSVFLNGYLHLQLEGATIRRCASFVGIDKQSFSDNYFDYKLCGQWFVTKTKHIFYHNVYVNEVFAVKIHSYDNLQQDHDAVSVDAAPTT